jgi:hypothetical protein
MTQIPADAARSDDGQWWWDGSQWQPVPSQEYAAPHAAPNAASNSETYVGYLEVHNFGFGHYRLSIGDISDPNKLGSLMYPAGRPSGVQIAWLVEGEGGGTKVDIFDVTLSTQEDLTAMAQPFAREITNATALESLPPTPEETAGRQERDHQEQAAFRAAVMPHLDPNGAVTGAMIVDDFTRWAGVHSTQDGWIVWVGRTPDGIEVSGFPATDLRDDERAEVVKQMEYYFNQGMTAEQAQLQSQVDFQNDLRLILTQVALAFIAA